MTIRRKVIYWALALAVAYVVFMMVFTLLGTGSGSISPG
jgi:hypothetical protein